MAMQSAPLHQGEVHFADQSSSQLQDDKGIDQTVAEDSDLAKEDLMVLIESMPHYDQAPLNAGDDSTYNRVLGS